jgi:energy-coupling factor transporter transmembrane protein EcfT
VSISILLGIVLFLITLILLTGIIKKAFGILFKIAVILLVIIIAIGGITIYDLHQKNIQTEQVHLVFSTQNDTASIQGGFVFNATKLQRDLNESEINTINQKNYSHITIIIITETPFEDITIEKGNVLQQYRNYQELLTFFRNDTIIFRPTTIGFKIIEALQ